MANKVNIEGVKTIYSRLIHAKILVVDDNFQDTEDNFIQSQADIIMTEDGVVIKSRLTKVPVEADLDKCSSNGHLSKLKQKIIGIVGLSRRVELD